MTERYAHFIWRPRRINDLNGLHTVESERPYKLIGEIQLSHIDYENFSEDLLADRAFLDQYGSPYKKNEPMRCVLVRCWNKMDGILVVPEDGFVLYAAYYSPPSQEVF